MSGTSQFQAEPVEGRRVSKVVKTTMVHGERMEKSLGDSSLATDLPSAKEDFEEVQKEALVHFVFVFLSCLLCVCFMCISWLLWVQKENHLSLLHFMHRSMDGVRVTQKTRFPS